MANGAWALVKLPEGGTVSVRKTSILAVSEAKGVTTIILRGHNSQLKLPGVSREAVMKSLVACDDYAPAYYDE